MGIKEIKNKLNKLLENTQPFTGEHDVVYFMVESRKILEHFHTEGMSICPTLRFYCDWSLHTRKDGMIPEIKVIFNSIKSSDDSSKELEDFIKMEQLKSDIEYFLSISNLDTRLTKDISNWDCFRYQLLKILSNQPLIIKKSEAKEFRFLVTDTGKILVKYT